MLDVILVINSGSSSIKFSIFTDQKKLNLLYHGEIENITDAPNLIVFDTNHVQILKQSIPNKGLDANFRAFFNWFFHLPDSLKLIAVGHRIVHGGKYFSDSALVTADVI